MNDICKQMNSDMFDAVERASYDVSEFSALVLAQAKESFYHNGYKFFESDGALSVKR